MNWNELGFKGIKQITNSHPLFVHFPIALFPAALLFYAIGILGNVTSFLLPARICLYLGIFFGILTVASGLLAKRTIFVTPIIGRTLGAHQTVGLTIFACAAALLVWSFFEVQQMPLARGAFLILLAITTLLIEQNGDIGSRLVYVEGAGVKVPAPVAVRTR
jgi:uncharacterized membrane protein